jgi:hypothetical protein
VVVLGLGVVASILLFARGRPSLRVAIEEERRAAGQLAAAARDARGAGADRNTLAAIFRVRDERLKAVAATLVPGGTRAQAGTALLAMVSGAAAGAGVRVNGTQVVGSPMPDVLGERRPDRQRAPAGELFTRVAVRCSGEGDVRGLTRLLLTMERGPMRLRVRELSIIAADPSAGDDRPEVLRFDLVVEGLTLAATSDTTGVRGSPRSYSTTNR